MASAQFRETANAMFTALSTTTTDLTARARSLPNVYSDYITSNASAVSQIEGALRSLTYLLPGARFHDSELASESLHSFIQVLSIYHDHLLKKRATILETSTSASPSQKSRLAPRLKPHARYTTFWSNSSSLYTKISTLIKMTQYTELLWEMVAKRRGGERTRWRVVVFLESFKAICKLILLRLTNSRPLLQPLMPLREDFAPAEPEQEMTDDVSDEMLKLDQADDPFNPRDAFGEAGVPTPPLSESGKPSAPVFDVFDQFNMPRTGLTLPNIPSPAAVSSYLVDHVITPDDMKPAKQLLHRLTSLQGQAAEVLYIIRPVIYVLMMQSVARRHGYEGTKWKKSWIPWVTGLTIEYVSRQLSKRDLESAVPGGTRSGLTAVEREELKRRGWDMAWWGMRGAFYENVTKKWVTGAAQRLEGKPLLDLVAGIVKDYDYLWSNYHFITCVA